MTLRLLNRQAWGAKYWKKHWKNILEPLYHPVRYILLYYHSYKKDCDKDLTCKKALKHMQKHHILIQEYPDIAYNFMIGGDGTVWEGRGWVTKPEVIDEKLKVYNGQSLDIAYIGDYRAGAPQEMNQAVDELVEMGIQFKYIHEDPEIVEVELADELRIVSRDVWGAREPKFPGLQPRPKPAESVFLRFYTGKENCWTGEECQRVLRNVQAAHTKDLVDIAHNFLIAQDGTIFEGRGWSFKSESPDFDMKKAKKMVKFDQQTTLSIAYIGNFDVWQAPALMTQAAKDLIAFGVKNNHIIEKYNYFEVYEPWV